MNGSGTDRPRMPVPPQSAQRARGNWRVVVLSAGVADIDKLQASGLYCVRATTAYEAAAEMLAEPTAALVVDLRLLSQGHTGLLAVARQMDTEVLAVGAAPAGLTGEQLSGVRLMAIANLPDALGKLSSRIELPEPISPDVGYYQPETPQTLAPKAAQQPAPNETIGPISRDLTGQLPEDLTEEALAELLRDPPGQAPASPLRKADVEPASSAGQERTGRPPASPSGLLTPEELAALLEDEP